MSIFPALSAARAGDQQSGRIVDCSIIEREVLELLQRNNVSEKERQDEEKEHGAKHIIESAEKMEFYFIWPIPLIFDEFTMD